MSDSELVEGIASAIYSAGQRLLREEAASIRPESDDWDLVEPNDQEAYRYEARAVLAAMGAEHLRLQADVDAVESEVPADWYPDKPLSYRVAMMWSLRLRIISDNELLQQQRNELRAQFERQVELVDRADRAFDDCTMRGYKLMSDNRDLRYVVDAARVLVSAAEQEGGKPGGKMRPAFLALVDALDELDASSSGSSSGEVAP